MLTMPLRRTEPASLGLCGVAYVVLFELSGPQRGTYSQVSRAACGVRRRSWVKPGPLAALRKACPDDCPS